MLVCSRAGFVPRATSPNDHSKVNTMVVTVHRDLMVAPPFGPEYKRSILQRSDKAAPSRLDVAEQFCSLRFSRMSQSDIRRDIRRSSTSHIIKGRPFLSAWLNPLRKGTPF